ncbi:MAG: (2Fe-2S)-binding protein [Gemmataceae bacterium]
MNDPQDPKQDGAQNTPNSDEFSRRDFLKGSGVAGAGAALGTVPLPTVNAQPVAQQAQRRGPNPVRMTFTINGRETTTNLEPRVTLLDALRNYLDITGCKRVCDAGTCGACTILLEGKPVYACSMLAIEADGMDIQTAESLVTADGEPGQVPSKFVQYDAQQCGFCTPGFVVSMHAVFQDNARPTPEEVEAGLAGNICRCGTYEQMRDAIYDLCGRQRRPAQAGGAGNGANENNGGAQ